MTGAGKSIDRPSRWGTKLNLVERYMGLKGAQPERSWAQAGEGSSVLAKAHVSTDVDRRSTGEVGPGPSGNQGERLKSGRRNKNKEEKDHGNLHI